MQLPTIFRQKPKATEGYRLGSGMFDMAIPPGMNYQSYLDAYGNVGWLFGAVSVIASSVAEAGWHLYQLKAGERVELFEHPALELLKKVNPFQTRYEFFQLLVMYRKLVGDSFITLNYNRMGYPAEMWLASPSFMKVIPHPTEFISHYEFERGANKVRFECNEVIRIKDPNPSNPLAGLGAAQSIGLDLDSEKNAARYQNKLFYNDGRPGLILSIEDSDPGPEAKKELELYWNQKFRGVSNAYKTAFLFGKVTPHMIALSTKDMDFKELRRYSRETILGAYHIPASIMGITENVNRANAEAGEYTFAKRVIKPELTQIREALNEQLCPLFGSDIEFDFDDPVPANREQIVSETMQAVAGGVITREEARLNLGYDPEPDGGTFLMPFSVTPVSVGEVASNPKALKHKFYSDQQKEAMWRSYVGQAEKDEDKFKSVLKKLFTDQAKEVISNIESWRDGTFNETEANEQFQKALTPAIEQSFKTGWAFADSTTRRPLKADVAPLTNPLVLEWIINHAFELARGLNDTSIKELRVLLAEGYALGESIPQLTQRIEGYFTLSASSRAEMIARTETINASNKGAEELYRSEGVQKVEWYTALGDERTCEECGALHGNIYPISEGPRPALHPNCRCVIFAYLD
jgi:HK97 family phage portal protein